MLPPFPKLKGFNAALEAMRLEDFIRSMDDTTRRDILLEIYYTYTDLLHENPASSGNHQPWPGGLVDHLAAMCRIGWRDYGWLAIYEPPPFGFDSVIVAIFCHDAEKLVRYGPPGHPLCKPFLARRDQIAMEKRGGAYAKSDWEEIKFELIAHWREQFGLVLTDDELNAITYTHGEGEDYSNQRRVMGPLATIVGNADRLSARYAFNYGKGMG